MWVLSGYAATRCSWRAVPSVLVIAGGLVTSNDAALSVPDWPLSWGRLVPRLEGGIRYEFAHRALAVLVAVADGRLAGDS